MNNITNEHGRLVRRFDGETLRIEPWGTNGLRVRISRAAVPDEAGLGALLPRDTGKTPRAEIVVERTMASIRNGTIVATLHDQGRLTFSNQKHQTILLREQWRNRDVPGASYSALNLFGRELKPLLGDSFRACVRFEAHDGEKLYGMGQYQDGRLDLKGSMIELAQRNSQASVPFVLSNRGYGFLWNNPAVGRATFAANMTEWVGEHTNHIDYWITTGDSPSEIEENYAGVTGTVPMMPEYAMGFWQCKLRYKNQEELLSVAREYKKRGLPLAVIVVDFFHWPMQGEWKFDKRYWPDPDAMVRELRSMGIELMVSVWPTVDKRSENYQEMKELGYLVRTERGIRSTMDFMGDCVFFDATNPGAREYVWQKIKTNYVEKGISLFWLDEAEPEYSVYEFDNYRYHTGSVMSVGNSYPLHYAQTFYEGQKSIGMNNPINLIRCAWAGSQRYGALVWSGDIDTTYESFRNQFAAGLNMAIAGIPWWTTDIGGFGGGDPDSPEYRELLIRWFQYGTFCPVFRLHGFRVDKNPQYAVMHPAGSTSEDVFSGGPNEVWSYGDEAYGVLKEYLFMRERLKPYITTLMRAAHEKGSPVMRPLFYDFPRDDQAWNVDDQYMFGPDILVAPILHSGKRQRDVYLPKGSVWKHAKTGKTYQSGQVITVEAPLSDIPLFLRDDAKIPVWK